MFRAKIGIALALAVVLSACNVTRHLDESKGEMLVVRNKLELDLPEKLSLSDKTALTYELGSLYKIKPNERSLRMFRWRLWAYYNIKKKDKGFNKWVHKRIAEPPALYNEQLTQKTASNFVNYLNQRGYFGASCTFENDTVGHKKMETTYFLSTGKRFSIDTIVWASQDSAVLDLIRRSIRVSALKPGAPLDGKLFDKEKLRITDTLKNNGYAYFVPNFVEFLGDSSDTKTRVTVDILTPTDSTDHDRYTIGSIKVYTSLVPDIQSITTDTLLNGVYYATSAQRFGIRPDKLDRAIVLQPGSMYRQKDFDRTAKNLNALGTFRFVSVRNFQDSIDPGKQNVVIGLTPNKRLNLGGNVELNTSSSSVSAQLIGVSVGGNFTNRNVFGGAEHYSSDLRYSLEFDISTPKQPIFSQEVAFNNQIRFPRFFDFIGWWKNMNRIGVGSWRVASDRAYQRVREEAQTRIDLNFQYLQLIDFYRYNLIKAAFGYDFLGNPGRQYSINIAGLDVLTPTLEPRFDSLYDDNDFFIRSFESQLFTGLIFRNFSLSIYTNPNKFGEHNFLRFGAELSGLEVEIANELWGVIFQPEDWRVGGIEFGRFVRLNLDVGYIRDFPNEVTFASRAGVGIARPYGGSRVTPYVKQFFVGGPSSIRAFRIREIGPGGWAAIDEASPTEPPFYQAADFRFELNAELRFPLFWWIKGAVFLDGGNVWSLDADDPRTFSQLEFDSYKQIAVGTGFGIRADFDFLVMRLDMGLPLRLPVRDSGIWFDYFNGDKLRFNPNLSVGYPF